MERIDRGEAYAAGRRRITEIVQAVPPDRRDAPVPACPAWRVRDLLAHLSGICADVLAGNVDGVATEPWTAAQVDARRDWPVERILEEWAHAASPIETSVPPHRPTSQWVFDLATHEHDLRGALGLPRQGRSDADLIALEFALSAFGRVLQATGRPALRVAMPDDERTLGDADPSATLAADPHTVLRALTGRRSLDQLHALSWTGDPTPHLAMLETGWGPFRAAATPIED